MTERERLIKLIDQSPAMFCTGCNECPEARARSIEMLADYLIASDVVEVRHGEWEFRGDGRYGQTRCYCSVCGKHSGIGGIRANQLKPFYPNCGAKMDGERREK